MTYIKTLSVAPRLTQHIEACAKAPKTILIAEDNVPLERIGDALELAVRPVDGTLRVVITHQ